MNKWWIGALCLLAAACGGGGTGGAGGTAVTPLAITSAATASVVENGALVYQATTAGGTGSAIGFTLGGPDRDAFTISASGALSFKAAPNFEKPTDADGNNSYVVTIQAMDMTGGTATREVTITVTNVADETSVAQVGGSYVGADDIASLSGTSKVLVAERGGTIYLVDPATRDRGTPYLTVTGIDTTSSPGRRGLMSVAGSYDYATSGNIYVFVSTGDAIEVRRYGRTAAGLGDPASADVILRVPSSRTSEDIGGWLGFLAPDELFVATGSAGTTPTNASLLGKVLLIDPTQDAYPDDPLRDYAIPNGNPFKYTPGAAPEIYASGFSDPWRGTVDGNNLYIVDQNHRFGLQGTTPLYRVGLDNSGRNFADNANDLQSVRPVLRAGPTLNGAGTLVPGALYRGPSPDLIRQFVFFASAGMSGTGYSGIYYIPNTQVESGSTTDTRNCCTMLSGNAAVAFGQDQYRNLFFTDGTALYMIRYS